MLLEQTHTSFQAKIKALAVAAGMTTEHVYQVWCDYKNQCFDQSALLSEMIDFHHDKLGGDKIALRDALDNAQVGS